ncbi:MAG: pseudouridine synthase [Acidobacteriota bacterium]|nr:pseudouridine synthase [Acidobacteriota bacterium]
MPAERLQKIIAAAGIASRRKAEELITQGRVSVNGAIVSTLGAKADIENDHIKVDGKAVHLPERNVYLLLHKPKGYVTTVSDPEGRPTVMELVRSKARLFPVGRLDWNTEGLLLLTNDGDLTAKLTHASTHVPKTYLVKVAGNPTLAEIEKLREGVMIGGEGDPVPGKLHRVRTAPAKIREVREGDNPWYEVTLIEGRNRQIRRMFEAIGHHVEKIKRVRYGPFELDVPPGESRPLRPHEVEKLKSYVSEPATAAREQGGARRQSAERGAPVPSAAGLPPAKRFGRSGFEKSKNFRFRAGAGRVGGRAAGGGPSGSGPVGGRPAFARGDRPGRPFHGGKPFRKDGDRPRRFDKPIRADHVEREGRPGGVRRFGADGVETPFEPRPSSARPPSGDKRFGGAKRFGAKPFGGPRREGTAGKSLGGPKRFGAKPFGGPRGEGGAKQFGAKPFGGPRGEGGAKRFGAKPFGGPRGEGGAKRFDAKPFGGPRGEGGPKRFGAKSFGGPRGEGGPKRFGAKAFGGPRGEGGPKRFGAKAFGGPRGEGGPKRFGAKPFGGPRRDGAAGKPFGGPKGFGAKRPFGGPKRFGAKSSGGPKRPSFGGRGGGFGGRGRTRPPSGDRG